MTEKQKSEVIRMRQDGFTYRYIAALLGLSLNTVKSFCNRNKTKKIRESGKMRETCLSCGKQLVQREKVKKRKFCCADCRVKWWNSHQGAVEKKALYKKTCACCGSEFTAYGNNHRKYCSHPCYIKDRFG